MPRAHPALRRRLIFLCGVGPVLVTAVLAAYRPEFLVRIDDAIYDTLLRSIPPTPPASNVVIVDVDERSLSSIGQWPWRRDVVGELITRLRDAGASVIALDIIFAEADRGGGHPVAADLRLVTLYHLGFGMPCTLGKSEGHTGYHHEGGH